MTLRLYPGRKNLDDLWRFKVTNPSYVYVVKAEGDRPIKVGYAANVITRMAEHIWAFSVEACLSQ